MAEDTTPKSRRALFSERLKKKHPDREWADDEEMFGQISDDYDAYDNDINGYKEREGRLVGLFNKNRSNAQFITDMARGEDAWINVIKRLGIDGITDLLKNPKKQEEYARANQEHMDKLAEEEKLQAEYDKNLPVSLQMVADRKTNDGISDDVLDAAWDLIGRITDDFVMGKVSSETFDMALKAVSHDKDVESAREEGVITGKNTRAEEKLRKPNKGDGTPNLHGAGHSPRENKRMSILDIATDDD